MSFGFGVGDIITVSKVAFRVCLAIREAPAEQAAFTLELEFFGQLVGIIGNRISSSDLPQSIAASAGQQVLQCQHLLQKLDGIITKYMATWPVRNGRNQFQRFKWGLYKRDQVARLLGDLRALISFLDFLVITYNTYVECSFSSTSPLMGMTLSGKRSRKIVLY